MKDVAIATYLDKDERLFKEFNWLYKSWVLSGSWLTSDLVVFHHPDVVIGNEDVIKVPVEPLTKEERWKDYPFINSVYFLTTPQAEFLKSYKYLMRTDHDVFLTPNFPRLRPRLATFGMGLYAQDIDAVTNLVRKGAEWGVLFQNNNIGSTIIAYSNTTIEYCKLHLQYCERMLKEEFTTFGGVWPKWFKGVLSMYAGCLAANKFFGAGLQLGGLDCHCMSQDQMCSTDYHIHAWHTNDDFSKFKWHRGEYNNTNFYALDKTIISNYCLYIAGVNQ